MAEDQNRDFGVWQVSFLLSELPKFTHEENLEEFFS